MANVPNFKIEGDKLVITVDISKAALEAAEPSQSGKTKTVSTTSGFNWATGQKGLGFSLTVSAK
jgi:hypothetical protein